jgi:hypothetical protein
MKTKIAFACAIAALPSLAAAHDWTFDVTL